jgi:DNA polymerase-1
MLTVRNANNFDWSSLGLEECARGNALDASFTLRVYELLLEKLEENGTYNTFDKLLSPLFPVFAEIEFAGLDVNPNELDNVGRTLMNLLVDIEDGLYMTDKVAKTANLTSTADLIQVLYTEEGFGFYPPKITEKGKPSTDKQTLDTLLDQIDMELEKRGKKKS